MAYKVVFMGTPDFAVPVLTTLIDVPDFEVVGVVTQPDRPAGRGKKIRQSPVKQAAIKYDLPVYQPEKLRGNDAVKTLSAWGADVHVVAAYGQILKPNVLSIPQYGSINVHASLLPRWRGAAPIQAAVRAGDAESGITIMQMNEGLDTGDMLLKGTVSLEPHETGGSLHDKLMAMGGDLLVEALRGYIDGHITPTPQDNDQATYAPQIDKKEGRIDWSQSAGEIDRLVRAFMPFPGTYTFWDSSRLKIIAGEAIQGTLDIGKVAEHPQHDLVVGTCEGLYALHSVQPEGKKPMSVSDFLNGNADIIGAELG